MRLDATSDRKRIERLAEGFDQVAQVFEKHLVPIHGRVTARAIRHEARWEFRALAVAVLSQGRVPSLVAEQIVLASWLVAFHRVMRIRGYCTEEICNVFFEIVSEVRPLARSMAVRIHRGLSTSVVLWISTHFGRADRTEQGADDDCSAERPSGNETSPRGQRGGCAVVDFLRHNGQEELVPYCAAWQLSACAGGKARGTGQCCQSEGDGHAAQLLNDGRPRRWFVPPHGGGAGVIAA